MKIQPLDNLTDAVLRSLAAEIASKLYEIDGKLCRVTYIGYPYYFQVDEVEAVKVNA